MSDDFEEIDDEDFEDIEDVVEGGKTRPDGAFDMIGGLFSKIPWKVAIFVFLLFIFVSSDLFIDWGLERFKGATEHRNATPKGVLIQSIFLTLGMIVVTLLVDINVI
jgi:hypothetical protein